MLDRLLDKLEPKRRHLASLVGLLVLTFVLTSVLAMQAQRAQTARLREYADRLAAMPGDIARQWSTTIRNTVADELIRALPVQSLHQAPQMDLAEVAALSRVGLMCPLCEPRLAAHSFFAVDLRDGTASRLGPAVPDEVIERVRQQSESLPLALVGTGVQAGIFFVRSDSTPWGVIGYTVLDEDERPRRLIGVVLDRASVAAALRWSFDVTPMFLPSFVEDRPNHTLFGFAASADGAPLLTTHARLPLHHAPVAGDQPMYGLSIATAVLPEARDYLAPGVSAPSISPVLLSLLAVIGAVLALAVLLVRREAELVRLRAEFISGVSHELRTPLAQIRMFTETLLLGRTRSDIERRRSLEIIDQEARRLTHLVENVLLFSRGEGGRRPGIAPEPTPFAGEIRRAIEGFGPMCRTRSVEIRAELQENITASVDRNALRQILINLLENALKYGPEGQRITVGLALFDDRARIWVDDEGPGIPVADRDRVFDSFHRLRRELEARVSGSGIGLSVVRELARLHGGGVRAESAPGGGARIVVEFPDAYLRAETAAEMPVAS